MQSSIFNNFFGFYMIFNYLVQPVFMGLVVFFMYRMVKYLRCLEKQNKALIEELGNKKCIDDINEIQDNQ